MRAGAGIRREGWCQGGAAHAAGARGRGHRRAAPDAGSVAGCVFTPHGGVTGYYADARQAAKEPGYDSAKSWMRRQLPASCQAWNQCEPSHLKQLLAALKDVNHMIQKASNLRMGTAKSTVVTQCRQAIKANNIQSLFQIIETGNDPQIGVVDGGTHK